MLVDHLEETTLEDRDYYVTQATVDAMAADGAPVSLVVILRRALGGRKAMDIEWLRR